MSSDEFQKQIELIPYRFRKANEHMAAETDAITFLRQALPDARFFPPAGGWGLDYQAIAVVVDYIKNTHAPLTVVELGSGVSTLWLRLALKHQGAGGQLFSMEQDRSFAQQVQNRVNFYSLQGHGELHYCPMIELDINDHKYKWYDLPGVVKDLSVDVLVVDGPISAGVALDRYPALPQFRRILSPKSLVLLDDTNRESERRISAMWQEENEDLSEFLTLHASTVYKLKDPGGPMASSQDHARWATK